MAAEDDSLFLPFNIVSGEEIDAVSSGDEVQTEEEAETDGITSGSMSEEQLQELVELANSQLEQGQRFGENLTSGMIMIAIFLGLIVGILLIHVFWHGGRH